MRGNPWKVIQKPADAVGVFVGFLAATCCTEHAQASWALRSLKKVFITLSALAVFSAGSLLLYSKFQHWQIRNNVSAARHYLETGDARSASLMARQILANHPQNADACWLMAELAQKARSPEEILWRQKLSKLQSGETGPLLDLAFAALRHGENYIADEALGQVSGPARQTAAFYQAQAACAIAGKRSAEAESSLVNALQLEPGNILLKLNLAALQLNSSDPQTASAAHQTLEQLRLDPQWTSTALESLLNDARARNDPRRAIELALELRQLPGAMLDERLLCLDVLQQYKDNRFTQELDAMHTYTGVDAGLLYALMTWMNAHGLAEKTIQWSEQMSPALAEQNPVPLAVAEACIARGDWDRLNRTISGKNWGNLEFLRLALAARAIDEGESHRHGLKFKNMFEGAWLATRGDTSALTMLARLSEGWGWLNEASQLWWTIAKQDAGQRTALKSLTRISWHNRDTRELYRVALRVFELEPANPAAQNNAAMLALLLGKDTARAHALALQNYKRFPQQPAIASTYAFSLYLQSRMHEASAVIASLPPTTLQTPSLAVVHGLVLSATGHPVEAYKLLEPALRQTNDLLPEEVNLALKALRQKP